MTELTVYCRAGLEARERLTRYEAEREIRLQEYARLWATAWEFPTSGGILHTVTPLRSERAA